MAKIVIEGGCVKTPDQPVIPYIEGDGTGPEIWQATRLVVDAAVRKAYGGERTITWKEVLAGQKAYRQTARWLPNETLQTIREHAVGIKGPLTTPVGEGFRSLNVTLRQKLDLYACVRPVRWIGGVPSPVRRPEDVDLVIFRENNEDVYAGIEWSHDSPEAGRMRDFLARSMDCRLSGDAGIGIKPISKTASERIVRKALEYAVAHRRPTVTLVHKGNIMKYTEGAFRTWGYELAAREFGDRIITEADISAGESAAGKIVVNDRIADSMFQQLLLRPAEYSVLVTTNLNGDYLSDAAAAQVGGLGMAPGANLGDGVAFFEATHGTAPKYAGLNKVNPGSLILSASMMLEYIGWPEAARLIESALQQAVGDKVVTYDLARQLPGATEVKTSGFAAALVERMGGDRPRMNSD